jgi:beta-lactam-binding protein with PASTA domain
LLAAEDKLSEAGCDWGSVSHAYSSTIGKGRVIRTTPPAGSHTSHSVRLVVSKGRKHHRARRARGRAAAVDSSDAVRLTRLAAAVDHR